MIEQVELVERGIRCDPYWDHPDPFEGDLYHEYIAKHPSFTLAVRSEVADRLMAAQARLPENWHIVLRAGYRPVSVQQAIFDSYLKDLKLENSDWSDEKAIEHARLYVTDPAI
ncbi:MAG: hypothetical protein ACK5O2_11715, partial [Microthrixaceae bacterium]